MSTTIVRMSFSALTFLLALSAVTAAAYAAGNKLKVVSQKVTKNEVTIASVTTTEDALIVIYPRNKAGEPDTSSALGHVAVKAGESTNVKVLLEQPASPGARLIAVLYADAGEKGRYEPGIDKPILRPVSNRFTVK